MLSYKNWKLYNESIGASFVLGVKQPQNIGTVGSTGASDITSEIDAALEEAKKCKQCKKMNGDMESPPEDEAPEKEAPEKEVPEKDEAPDEAPEKDEAPDEAPEKDKAPEKKPPEDASPEEGGDKPTLFQKKRQKSKMKKEDVEFWSSLQKMLHGGLPGERFRDGTNGFTEDALLAPIDPNKGVVEEPGPGEVGYAPQTRIGEV